MRKFLPIIGGLCLFIISCEPSQNNDTREAWVPVYGSPDLVQAISSESSRPTVNAGKMYVLGNILYQVEVDSGIHVINFSNPSNPQKIGFIKSFLCKELAVKNGLIYTNNVSDLVVIDATNVNAVREVSRTRNAFPDLALQYPTKPNNFSTIFFECSDPNKGIVIAWEKKQSSNAKCRR